MRWLLALLFFCVPLVFSHLLLLLGIPVVIGGFWAYEWLKLAVISLLLFLIVFWCSIFPSSKPFFEYQKGLIIAIGTLFGIFGIHVFLGAQVLVEYFGNQPFFMGFYSFCLMWVLAMCGSWLTTKELHFSIRASFAALFFVSLYSVLQKIGLDPIEYGTSFRESRVFSTIGNPNSLALYDLLFLPLILLGPYQRWKWLAGLLLVWIIFITGSLSLFFIACLFYVGALCYEAWAPKWWYIFCVVFLGITGLQWILLSQGTSDDKYLSLMTRATIWSESFWYLVQYPSTLLWGTPQADVLAHLNENRSAALLRYIPSDYMLLHLHNTWLDILFKFGVLGLWGIAYGLRIWYRKVHFERNRIFESTLVLAIFAGCFHHLEIVHWMVLLLVLLVSKNNRHPVKLIKKHKSTI